jgi:hypothetical protein
VNTPIEFADDVEYLVEYAGEDWVGMSPVTAVASAMAGKGATLDQQISALLTLIGDLMDRGAVPGDLIKDYPDFIPWSGTKDEILQRIARETRALGELPDSGEVTWLHVVDEDSRA